VKRSAPRSVINDRVHLLLVLEQLVKTLQRGMSRGVEGDRCGDDVKFGAEKRTFLKTLRLEHFLEHRMCGPDIS
jgi:hypothetical protein